MRESLVSLGAGPQLLAAAAPEPSSPVMIEEGVRRPTTWCVETTDGLHYLVPFERAGGPVSVWSNGTLVSLRHRHPLREPGAFDCAACAAPSTVRIYLPMLTWSTTDPDLTAPGRRARERGTFAAVFHGGPGHTRMWVRVMRTDSWHTWQDYAVVDLDPRGDWRTAFDTWRTLATGYEPERTAGATSAWP